MRNSFIARYLLFYAVAILNVGASVPEDLRLGNELVLRKASELTDREMSLTFRIERGRVRVAEWMQRIDVSRAKQSSARTVEVLLVSPERLLVIHVVNENVFLSDVRFSEKEAPHVRTQRLLRRGPGGGAVWEATGAKLTNNTRLDLAAIDMHGEKFDVTFEWTSPDEDWRVIGDYAPLYTAPEAAN